METKRKEVSDSDRTGADLAGLKLLMLITWRERGEWYLYRKLRERAGSVDILQPAEITRPWPGFARRIIDALAFLAIPVRAFMGRDRYDAVCSWSLRMGVCYGLLKRLGAGGRERHIVRDFHLNLARGDWRYRLRLALLRLALPGMDTILCTSREEARLYAGMFGIRRERMLFFPDAPPSQFVSSRAAGPPGDYIFSCGNSDRDFETLIRSVRGTGRPAVILSQVFVPREPLPANVRLISERISYREMEDLARGARAVVVPLEQFNVAAGQNSMLEAMALGRPVIVSENFATLEHASHGLTALFYPPGDSEKLSELIEHIYHDSGAAEAMAEAGRLAAGKLLDEQVEILTGIIRRFVSG